MLFNRCVKQPVNTVTVILVVLGSVNTALSSDAVGSPWAILIAEAFDLIPQLGKGG
jgi:hypothetical protein